MPVSMSDIRQNALLLLHSNTDRVHPRRVAALFRHILLKERKFGWQEGAEWQQTWGDPNRPGEPHPSLDANPPMVEADCYHCGDHILLEGPINPKAVALCSRCAGYAAHHDPYDQH